MCASRYRSIVFVLALLATSFSVATADVTAGLVSHWMMDDGSGSVATDSVGGHDGLLQGDATWAEGFIGGALRLDGNGDYVDCGNQAAFNITDAVTLAAWVQARNDFAYPDWSGIIMRGGPNIDTYALYYHWSSKRLGFKTTGTNPNWLASNTNAAAALFDGDWHHVAATYDGTTKRVYLDGVEIINAASVGKIETSNGRLLLGAGRDQNPPTLFVAGRIDDARLYKRGLPVNDVKALMPPKLQAYEPEPANEAVGVAAPLFRWKPGDTGVFHDLYLGKMPDLGPADLVAPGLTDLVYWHQPGLDPGQVYYWRVDEIEADGTTVHTGNVWSFVTQAETAYHPDPADGATDASPTPTLTWLSGQAAGVHHVYFSDSFDAVSQGTPQADKGEQAETSFAPGDLLAASTYYWRVDETVPGPIVKTGPVWTFTTYLPIDDFESYNDEQGKGTRIYETWFDGWTNNNGMTVGYTEPPFAEQKIVHGGLQSMPLDYNNIPEPYYSEAELEFLPVADWTINGVNTLVLFVRGNPTNSPAPLYLRLEDSSKRTATVVHPDPAVVVLAKWTEWRIPLSDFGSVNAMRIRKICIGVGDQANPKPGGTGLILIDDIYVSKP